METSGKQDSSEGISTIGEIRTELLALIYSFRMYPIIREVLRYQEITKDGSELSEKHRHLYESHLAELRNYFAFRGMKITPEFIQDELNLLENTFKYLNYDMSHLWTSNLDKALQTTHQMTTTAMSSYVNSMHETGQVFEHGDTLDVGQYVVGKRVLDFGCGSGFFYDQSIDWFESYVGFDRPEVFDHTFEFLTRINSDLRACVVVSPQILREEYTGWFNTIWLSQVIHSKEDPIRFIQELEYLLKPEGTILVCGVREGSARSIGLNTQLRIHSGVEGVGSHHELEKYITRREDTNLIIGTYPVSEDFEVTVIEFWKR